MGPATQLKKRLHRGDLGVSPMDTASMAHDIRYSLAKTPGDIQSADRRFLKKARTVKDFKTNRAQGIAAIGAKYAYESNKGVQYPTASD